MVISELTKTVRDMISNSDSPELEAEYIVMSAMDVNRTSYITNRNSEATRTVQEKALKMAQRRQNGEPLAYILSCAEFMGLTFKVSADTLIPRADTETLAEFVIRKIGDRKLRILDIGTGSGCIGISIAHFCKNAAVTMLDISKEALNIAMYNADMNNVHAEFLLCDILKAAPQDKFDIIVSNPPYIRTDVIATLQTEVKDYEPISALDGGEDGLIFYRRICEVAKSILTDSGMLAFETGFDQRKAVTELMTGYKDIGFIKDLCGNDRVVYGTKA